VDERLENMTPEQKAASLLMLHAPGTDPAPLRALAEQGIAGLILMGDNVPATPAELLALTDAVQVDPEARTLLGIDEEGGIVQRLPWDDAAGAGALRPQPPAATEQAFARRGELLEQAGVDVNFGIVADVTADPNSFISDRVLGTDPAAAAERVAAAVTGEGDQAASTLKHFPGHGAAPGDSHSSVPSAPLTLDEWRAGAAPPFAAGIEAGADLVMTGHLVYPAVDAAPASLSPEWHRILREELGFDGVVVSDDLLMLQHNGLAEYADPNENAIRAIAAGTDLLLYVLPADPSTLGVSVDGLSTAIADAVRAGRIPEARLDDAAARVLELRHRAAG
jgi:beta-N-acetylhexosaminidase